MLKMINKFRRDEKAATAIEYGLIAALIALVLITVLTNVGSELTTKFSSIATAIQAAG